MNVILVRQFGSAPPLTRRWIQAEYSVVPNVGWDVWGPGGWFEVAGLRLTQTGVEVLLRQEATSKLKQAEADGWRP